MRKTRKILAIVLIVAVVTIWFFLPSSDLDFPYFYCLGFFLLISALFIYPIQAVIIKPGIYDRTENP